MLWDSLISKSRKISTPWTKRSFQCFVCFCFNLRFKGRLNWKKQGTLLGGRFWTTYLCENFIQFINLYTSNSNLLLFHWITLLKIISCDDFASWRLIHIPLCSHIYLTWAIQYLACCRSEQWQLKYFNVKWNTMEEYNMLI